MLWFILALLTAVCFGFYNITLKKASHDGDALAIIFVVYLLIAIFIFIYGAATFQLMLPGAHIFWIFVMINAAANAFVAPLYIEALKSEDLAMSVPLLNLTPVFLIFSSVIIAGEVLTAVKVAGVLIIVSGAYLLNLGKGGLLGPFRTVLSNRGSRYMLLIAFTWGITAAMDKVSIVHSNPITYGFLIFTLICAFLTISLVITTKKKTSDSTLSKYNNVISRFTTLNAKKLILITGIIAAVMIIAQFTAISMGNVAYVIPIKRSGTILSVIGGIYLFNEKRSFTRVSAVVIMIIGVFVIALL